MAGSSGSTAPGLALGVLGRAHGLRGEIFLRTYNPDGKGVGGIRLPQLVRLAGGSGAQERTLERTLTAVRSISGGSLVRFAGVDTRGQAEAFTDLVLTIARAALPALEPGEFFVGDLVGCAAVDPQGTHRGVVRSIYWNGAQDILVVQGEHNEEILVPVVPDFIRSFQADGKIVVVEAPEWVE